MPISSPDASAIRAIVSPGWMCSASSSSISATLCVVDAVLPYRSTVITVSLRCPPNPGLGPVVGERRWAFLRTHLRWGASALSRQLCAAAGARMKEPSSPTETRRSRMPVKRSRRNWRVGGRSGYEVGRSVSHIGVGPKVLSPRGYGRRSFGNLRRPVRCARPMFAITRSISWSNAEPSLLITSSPRWRR